MSQPRAIAEIEVRECTSLAEYEGCVRIEHATWGEQIAVPSAVFVVAHDTGGQVIGAFDGAAGEPKMVGFTLALAGVRGGEVFLHSHMTAVLPGVRDQGVGRRLKLFQRQDALKRGIALIEWTFDPLELKNAHFNLVRLGAVARRYIPNCYGITESALHGGLPTDRLVAEWWLDSERVKSILVGDPMPSKELEAARVAVPTNFDEIRTNDVEAAARVQAQTRAEFAEWFRKGYVATGVENVGGTTRYILERRDAVQGLGPPKMPADGKTEGNE
jgi:predicted GNAT superfamily acetyltransferase